MAMRWPEHEGSNSVAASWRNARPVREKAGARKIWNEQVAERSVPDACSIQDIAWLASLGYKAYRFEIPWPMVALGVGRRNEKGIACIKALLVELRKYGMLPIVKVNHWRQPLLVQMDGDWVNLKSDAMAQYFSDVLHEQFGQEVSIWMNQQEPWHAAHAELRLWRAYMKMSDTPWEAEALEWEQAADEGVQRSAWAQYLDLTKEHPSI